ncbi:MAG: VWA domain-containing protein [Candidatus Thorarchaeota archaeon]
MKLKAISGKNQRGYSFVAPQGEPFTTPVQLKIGTKYVLTRIRESPRVPQDLVIIDKRLYKSMNAEAGTEVELITVDDDIPHCEEMTLVVSEKRDIDVREVVKALSAKIEDMEDHLDGLILTVGQKLDFDSLGISITVNDITPRSKELGAALVEWRKVLRVYLEANLGSNCFNVAFVMDIGAASRKSDILTSGDGAVQRIEAADNLSSSLLESLSFCDGTSFFSSIVFSEDVDILRDSENEGILRIDSRSIGQEHSEWVSSVKENHDGKASNPSDGLAKGIESAKKLRSKNNKPTILLFISSGTYSQGGNPVATVRKELKDAEGISIICVGLGIKCEETLLQAIADSAHGTVVIIKDIDEIPQVKEKIINEIGKDV